MRSKVRHNVLLSALAIGLALARGAHAQDVPAPVEDRARAIDCLTLAIAYEAGNESTEGKQAVAEVVLNRVRSPSYPKTVCDVVFAGSTRRTGCQFTFTCDGSLYRHKPSRPVMAAATAVAEEVLARRAPLRVPGATHYHADYVSPYWAPSLARVAKIGAHIFYQPRTSGALQSGATAIIALAADASPSSLQQDRPARAERPAFAPWGIVLVVPAAAPATSGDASSQRSASTRLNPTPE